MTFSPVDSAQDRWLQRALSQAGENLAAVRDRLFSLAQPQRHHVILDLNAGSGLLTWEALRQVPEGGVYAVVRAASQIPQGSPEDAKALQEQSAALPELARPVILQTLLSDLPTTLATLDPHLRFDRIIGRNALLAEPDKARIVQILMEFLHPDGSLVLAETVPQHTQRLYDLVDAKQFDTQIYKRLVKSEEAIYQNVNDAMVNWDADRLRSLLQEAGLTAEVQLEKTQTDLRITSALLERWLSKGGDPCGICEAARPSYGDHLAGVLNAAELTAVQAIFRRTLTNQMVKWKGAIAFCRVFSP